MENKDIISCNAKNQKHAHKMQNLKVADSHNPNINSLSHSKRKDDDSNGKKCQKEALHMQRQV